MGPKEWIELSGLALNGIVLLLAVGMYFGRQEFRGARRDDPQDHVVVRRQHDARVATRMDNFEKRLNACEAICGSIEGVRSDARNAIADVRGMWSTIDGLKDSIRRVSSGE